MGKHKKPAKDAPIWKKVWFFLWHDDSTISWIVNTLLAYVVIKFLLYPGIGIMLNTTHPVVAVVSESMEHGLVLGRICGEKPDDYGWGFSEFWKTCGKYYENRNISMEQFSKFSFTQGINKGDIIVLAGRKPEEINVGDVIIFQAAKPDPIIHRVVKKWQESGIYHFQTKGDHNEASISGEPVFETDIEESRLVGKALFKIPLLGYVKIGFVEFLKLVRLDSLVGKVF